MSKQLRGPPCPRIDIRKMRKQDSLSGLDSFTAKPAPEAGPTASDPCLQHSLSATLYHSFGNSEEMTSVSFPLHPGTGNCLPTHAVTVNNWCFLKLHSAEFLGGEWENINSLCWTWRSTKYHSACLHSAFVFLAMLFFLMQICRSWKN